jgi:hypothetical protein
VGARVGRTTVSPLLPSIVGRRGSRRREAVWQTARLTSGAQGIARGAPVVIQYLPVEWLGKQPARYSLGGGKQPQGLLYSEDDIGLLVSSGGFTSDAEREARASHKHVELMDLARLISLWKEHYASLREKGRNLLPLVQVHFLAPDEEDSA